MDKVISEIAKNQIGDTVSQMKSMNLDEKAVKQVQEKLENPLVSIRQSAGVSRRQTSHLGFASNL